MKSGEVSGAIHWGVVLYTHSLVCPELMLGSAELEAQGHSQSTPHSTCIPSGSVYGVGYAI